MISLVAGGVLHEVHPNEFGVFANAPSQWWCITYPWLPSNQHACPS
jgi:hypothetical protein